MMNTANELDKTAVYSLVILTGTNFLNYMDRSAFSVILAPIQAELGLSNTELGLLAGAFGILYAGLSLPLAILSDRYNRTRIVALVIGAWSLATVSCGLARNFPQLFIARMSVGIGEAGCLPACTSLIADYFAPKHRPAATSFFMGGGHLGIVAGLVIIGFLAESHGWRTAIIAAGIPGILIMLIVFLTMNEPKRGKFDNQTKPFEGNWVKSLSELLKKRTYLLILLAFPSASLGLNALGVWGPTFFARSFDMPLSKVGLYFGLSFGLCGTVGAFLGGSLISRLMLINRKWEFWLPSVSYLACVPIYLFALSARSEVSALVFVGLGTVVGFLGYGPAISCMQVVAPLHSRAVAISIAAFAAAMIGLFVGPAVIGFLTDLYIPDFGDEALRYSLMTVMSSFLLATTAFFIASFTMESEKIN